MQRQRHLPAGLAAAALAVLALALGCAGSSSSGDAPASPATGTVAMSVSDASTEDWAVIGVKLLGIALTPQGGGTPQTILTAPAATAPVLNLIQLDNLSDVLGNAQVPAGTYTQATLTLAANPGDVTLTAANSPAASFAGTPGATIPSYDIQIKPAPSGATGSLTTTITVPLAKPLVVTAGQTGNLDVEFILSHPAFIVDHEPASGDTIWTVNFNKTVRHNLVAAPEQMVLRHLYGTVTQATSSALTVTRDFASLPGIRTPTAQVLQLGPDPVNGTQFYDLDTPLNSGPVTSFSAIGPGLVNRYIRAAVRFQGGTLVAARLWASATFKNVWLSPEGHVTQVAIGTGSSPYQIYVESENGAPVAVTLTNETQFFFRRPADPAADASPLATGTTFMDDHDLVRGFKVHVSYADPTATPLVAASVDIETARYSGDLSAATVAGFTYSHNFVNTGDDYTATLGYLPAGTANGNDSLGTPVLGFQWWNLTQFASADSDSAALTNAASTAISDFYGTVTGNVDFGGSVTPIKVWGTSAAIPDPAVQFPTPANGWDARFTVLVPTRMPKGTVAPASIAITGTGASFAMTVAGGTLPVTVDLTNAATLVYQIDLSGGVYSLSAVDLTTPAGVATFTTNFGSKYPVVVYGVPQLGGKIMAYALYYTTTAAI